MLLEYSIWSIFYSDNGNEMEMCAYIYTHKQICMKNILNGNIFMVIASTSSYPKAFGRDKDEKDVVNR